MNTSSQLATSSMKGMGKSYEGADLFTDDIKLLKRISLVLALIWTLILGVSLYLNIQLLFENAYDMAHRKAAEHFSKEMALRLWGISKGGVYLNIAKNSPPIEYLHFLQDRVRRQLG